MDLILDAKLRKCFFNADDDKDLANAILEVHKELDLLDKLLDGDSVRNVICNFRLLELSREN